MKAKAGDIYCCYNNDLKKYTACQVVKLDGVKEKNAVLLMIDWVGDSPMTEQDVHQIKPLYLDFFYWNRGFHLTNVRADVPSNYSLVGNCEPLADESSNSYSDWDNGYKIYRQLRWELIAEEKRTAFKSASNSSAKVMLAGKVLPLSSTRFYDTDFEIKDIGELSVLPCLSTLHCERWYTGIYEYLESNPFITELRMVGHEQRILDFRKSHIRKLLVDLSGVETIYLNEDMEHLIILNTAPDTCHIATKDFGQTLQLDFQNTVNGYPSLPNLSALHCTSVEEIDFAAILKAYPKLNELRLWGNPGKIKNFALLSLFKEMQRFSTVDLFGFTADDIPKPEEMERLYWFWMSSLPEDAAKAAKQLFKKRKAQGLNLWIQKARKPEWLAQNLDNPFRSWDGQENIPSSVAKKAAAVYKNMREQILRLIQDDEKNSTEQVLELVTEYTNAFNKMDKRAEFIETVEREDIYTALADLLALLPEGTIDSTAMFEKFDQLRDF